MDEYQRYQKTTDTWINIHNCPIKLFRRKYPRVKTRLKPIDYTLEIVSEKLLMIKKFLITL